MRIALALMGARDFLAQHLVWVVALAVVLFAVLMPSAALAVFRFLTTTLPGQIITACVVAGLVGWFVRGFIDDAAHRREEILAARQAAAQAQALAKQLDDKISELRRQAAASDRLADAARERAQAIAAATAAYQKKESDYETELGKHPARACALRSSDVRRLRDAARVFRPKLSAIPAAPAR